MEPVTRDDEEKLWSTGCRPSLRPRDYSMLFSSLTGKIVLPGGNEHRCLKISQIVHKIPPEGKVCHTCIENCSMNQAGGFNQLSVPNTAVHQYQHFQAGERCHVNFLDKYLSKLPINARDKDIFHLRPAASAPIRPAASAPTDDISPWYVSMAIGKNPLSRMIKIMCKL